MPASSSARWQRFDEEHRGHGPLLHAGKQQGPALWAGPCGCCDLRGQRPAQDAVLVLPREFESLF